MTGQANTRAKLTAVFAAAVVTALTVGGQFGLAQHDSGEADAPLAGQPAAGLVALAALQQAARCCLPRPFAKPNRAREAGTGLRVCACPRRPQKAHAGRCAGSS